jgi:hypothetical protein
LPGINRIEEAWTKTRQFLRATRARTEEDLDQTVADAFSYLIACDEQAWFLHSMSALQKL